MKSILVLGAGQSSPYLIKYLLEHAEQQNWFVTVADMNLELAKSRVGKSKFGKAIKFDAFNEKQREALIKDADVVVNLLIPSFQFLIAKECVKFKKSVVSASYENPKVKALHKDAKKAGILILNEMGLDPGIDIMSAMKLVNRIKKNDGVIKSFISWGSAIPAPDVESNPLKYCITWNPKNVATAGKSGAQYLENGKVKIASRSEVFNRTWFVDVDNVGKLEGYPNRDSLSYIKKFGLGKVKTMIRGTLRYAGYSEVWNQIIKFGFANDEFQIHNLQNKTMAEFTEMFIPGSCNEKSLENRVAEYLKISLTGPIMEKLRWLGLFSDEKIKNKKLKTAADVLSNVLITKLPLPKNERDMVILMHDIIAEYPATKKKKRFTSTMIDLGERSGMTAIAKTVGLPAAIAVKLILQDKLNIAGCCIPVMPEIYSKVLPELKSSGIQFKEKVKTID